MPEVHVQKQLADNVLTDEDKAQQIEELRKTIEGKFKVFKCFQFSLSLAREFSAVVNVAVPTWIF